LKSDLGDGWEEFLIPIHEENEFPAKKWANFISMCFGNESESNSELTKEKSKRL